MYHSHCQSCLILLAKYKNKSDYLTDQNYKGNTPIFILAEKGHVSTCEMLMKYFTFDVNIVGENGDSLLHIATRQNNVV